MTSEQYEQFLSSLFNEYVRNRIASVDEKDLVQNMKRIRAATEAWAHITARRKIENNSEVPALLKELEFQLEFMEEIFEKSGIFEVLDRHFDEIADHIEQARLPNFEYRVLQELQSTNPQQDMRDAIDSIKIVSEKRRTSAAASPRQELQKSRELVIAERKELQTTQGRAGFWRKVEPIGKIFRGAGTAGFNIAAGCGVLPALGIILPPAAVVGGAVVILSAISGFGLVIEGTGKLMSDKK